jgi:hypothetical protein
LDLARSSFLCLKRGIVGLNLSVCLQALFGDAHRRVRGSVIRLLLRRRRLHLLDLTAAFGSPLCQLLFAFGVEVGADRTEIARAACRRILRDLEFSRYRRGMTRLRRRRGMIGTRAGRTGQNRKAGNGDHGDQHVRGNRPNSCFHRGLPLYGTIGMSGSNTSNLAAKLSQQRIVVPGGGRVHGGVPRVGMVLVTGALGTAVGLVTLGVRTTETGAVVFWTGDLEPCRPSVNMPDDLPPLPFE